MSKREDIFEQVTDFVASIIKKQEKGFLRFLETVYSDQYIFFKTFLISLFEKASREDGKLYQEDLFKYGRDKQIKEQIKQMMKEIEKAERKALKSEMETAMDTQNNVFFYLFFMLGIDTPFKPITEKQKEEAISERWTGETYEESNQKNKEDLARKLFNSIVAATIGGAVLNSILKQTQKDFESGIKKTQLIMQTEASRKKNKATFLSTYALDKKIKRYRWIATLDELTCEICQKHDRKIYQADDLPKFPAHPRCRCGLNPVLEDIDPTINEEIKTRRARSIEVEPYKRGTGYITNMKNFEDWTKEVGAVDLKKAQDEGRKRAYPHRNPQTHTPKLEIRIKTK